MSLVMKQASDFGFNEKLKNIIMQASLTYDDVASLLSPFYPNIKKGHICKWINKEVRMRKEIFDDFIEELPEFINDKIVDYQQEIKSLEHCYKHVVSVIHNNLHQ